MEIYQQIKVLEAEQADVLKKHADSDFVKHQQECEQELADLEAKLESASRSDTKAIKDRILALNYGKQKVFAEINRIED